MNFNKYRMLPIIWALVSGSAWAGTSDAKFLNQLENMDDYKGLARTQGKIEFVKYTFDFSEEAKPVYFQNTETYEWHFPFLKENVAKFKDMSNQEYQELIGFEKPANKKLTAGAGYLVRGLQVPGVNGPEFLGISIYYPRDLDEYVNAVAAIKAATPLTAGNVVVVFEDQRDYFKYFRPLQSKGIPSVNFKVIEDRGNVIDGGKDDHQESDKKDDVVPSGMFDYGVTNHMWNSFTVQVDQTTVIVSTPQGDDQDEKRNISFGFRPKVIYNQIEVTHGNETLKKALWDEDFSANGFTNTSIFCESVQNIEDVVESNFPKSVDTFSDRFNVSDVAKEKFCGMKINVPGKRPGVGEGVHYVSDYVCMFSPKKLMGKGPEAVALYVPFEYAPHTNGWLEEKATDNAQICIDGKLSPLKLKN